jgi:hypothetical protein
MSELQQIYQALAGRQPGPGSGPAPSGDGGQSGDDDVIDAEFDRG